MTAPLRCRPGELAIVVGDESGLDLGRIVRCLQAHPAGWSRWETQAGPIWTIDQPMSVLVGWKLQQLPEYPDQLLRPLRDSDGTDEMLRIAGLPQPIETPAPVEPEHAA